MMNRLDIILAAATTAPADVDPRMVAAWVLTGVALAVSATLRRRLPHGLSAGLFIGGLSALLLLNYVSFSASLSQTYVHATALVGLAVLWLIVSVWVERDQPVDRPDDRARRDLRRLLGLQIAGIAGVAAAGTALAGSLAEDRGGAGLLVLGVLLFAVALVVYAGRRWRPALHAAFAAAAAVVIVAARIAWSVPLDRISIAGAALLIAAALLLAVIATVLVDWRRRIAIWRSDPRRLVDPPPPRRTFNRILTVAAVVVAVGVMLDPLSPLVPLALLLAAFGALIIGHRLRSNAHGEWGLALVVLFIVGAGGAWWPGGLAGWLFGFALGGAYMLWLARFWDQQLRDGQPWTTTGRLIPAAATLATTAAGGMLLVTAALAHRPPDDVGVTAALLTVLVTLAFAALLMRRARTTGAAGAAAAAAMVFTAFAVATELTARALGGGVPVALPLAVAGGLMTVRATSAVPAPARAVQRAFGVALLPLASLYACLDVAPGDFGPLRITAAVVALVTMIYGGAAGGSGDSMSANAENDVGQSNMA
jgi:hypothetical protein